MPHHPYTQALIRAIPDFGSAMPHKSRLNTLPGAIPLLEQLPIGCRLGATLPVCTTRMHCDATFDGGEKSSLCLSFPTEHGERVR